MKNHIEKIKNMEVHNARFVGVVLLCSVIIFLLLSFYFGAYRRPYLMNEIIDLSEGWQYSTGEVELGSLDTLRTGPKLHGEETLTLYRILDTEIDRAALLVRSNHQNINVYLDGSPLYLDGNNAPGKNPGMALHFISLPENYLGKMLTVKLTSPYALYAGRTSPILMGTIPSLEAYALSHSMRSVVLMSMCLLIGFGILVLTLVQAIKGSLQPQHLAIGIFAVIWALYYVCTDYIVFQFFTPFWVSALSLGLYFTFQAPLVLYFYFSFQHYKKLLFPAVLLHGGFAVASVLLQLFGIVDLPQLITPNNVLLAGLFYTIVLAVLEAVKGNRTMMLSVPFFIIAYLSMLYNFYVFYTRKGIVFYTYRDTYFLLLLCILVSNAWRFFRRYYREISYSEMLTMQNRMAKESYEQVKAHLQEAGSMKHELKNHLAALQTYLRDGRYDEAACYLEQVTGQSAAITPAVYHSHFLINAMAGSLAQRAQAIGAQLELDLKAEPLHIAESDLYSLLSNMLDNALEACCAVPEGRVRLIRLTIARRESYLHFTCKNSKAGKPVSKAGRLQTSKSNPAGHGYGLWTMERIAERYDGLMDMDYDDSMFTVTVAIKDK